MWVDCGLRSLGQHPVTYWKQMVGLGGLEPPTSPLSVWPDLVLQQLTRPRGLPKYAEIVQDIIGCGLDCGLENYRKRSETRLFAGRDLEDRTPLT